MKRTATPYILAAALIALVAAGLFLATGLRAGPGSLAGSSWQLSELNGRPAQAPAEPVSLNFDQQGQVSGNGGCNGFGGEYAVAGSDLKISGLISTMRACEDQGLNDQEGAYFAALDKVAAYELAGDQLTLRDAAGNPVLVFVAS